MGFVGRTAIHPQLAVIAAAFRPTDDELSWAREVLVATAAGGVDAGVRGDGRPGHARPGRVDHRVGGRLATARA